MSSHFEKEVPCANAAHYESGYLVATAAADKWTTSAIKLEESIPCTILPEGVTIRIQPMNGYDWDEQHFHSKLRLPMECSIVNGIIVTLEASARECVAVALSPKDSFVMGKTYVVHFGAAGNSTTVIRRRLSHHEAVHVYFPGSVCTEQKFIHYWICLFGGKIYAGIGTCPGKQCVGVLDDSLYNQLRSGIDAVRYVGLGNSAIGRQAKALKVRNICVSSVPDYLPTILEALPPDLPLIHVDAQDSGELQELMQEYQNECLKAKKRAEKFGIPYKEPPPQAFFQWSKARKLRANPQKGFITGMDIMSKEELEKQKVRAARFGVPNRDANDEEKTEVIDDDMDEQVLPLNEAWDNEELVREHRWDPPKSLWIAPPEVQPDAIDENSVDVTEEPKLMPEMVHLCSIDWAAFKQIRTDDIMSHFAIYGPSYIEWLGDLSCNVLFEDKYSAARALNGMSHELPSPPPDVLHRVSTDDDGPAAYTPPDFGNMGWRLGHKPIRKVTKDRFGRVGTSARILMRVTNSTDVLAEKPTSQPKPPPGFTTKRVLGPGDDFGRHNKRQRRVPHEEENDDQEHPALMRGLRAGRDGYTVEDLRAARTKEAAHEHHDEHRDVGPAAADDLVPWDENPCVSEA